VARNLTRLGDKIGQAQFDGAGTLLPPYRRENRSASRVALRWSIDHHRQTLAAPKPDIYAYIPAGRLFLRHRAQGGSTPNHARPIRSAQAPIFPRLVEVGRQAVLVQNPITFGGARRLYGALYRPSREYIRLLGTEPFRGPPVARQRKAGRNRCHLLWSEGEFMEVLCRHTLRIGKPERNRNRRDPLLIPQPTSCAEVDGKTPYAMSACGRALADGSR